jgi:hypothetical protein
VTARNLTIGTGLTGDSANAVFSDDKPAGISDSEGGDSASDEEAAIAFRRLRGLYARVRWARTLVLLG